MRRCSRKTSDQNRTMIFPLLKKHCSLLKPFPRSTSHPERFTNSRFYSPQSQVARWLVFRFHLSSKVILPSDSALHRFIFSLNVKKGEQCLLGAHRHTTFWRQDGEEKGQMFPFYRGNGYINWLLYLDAAQTACSLSIRTALSYIDF